MRTTAEAPFVKGDTVEIYSASQKEWLSGNVSEVAVEDIIVKGRSLKAGTLKVEHAFGTKYVRPDKMASLLRKPSMVESSLQSSQNDKFRHRQQYFIFSVVNASLSEVVTALREYLEQWKYAADMLACSEWKDLETSVTWQETVTIFIDFVPLLIQIAVKKLEDSEIIVTVKDLSLNDIVRLTRVFKGAVDFAKSKGLCATCKYQPPQHFHLLDDDFDSFDDVDCIQLDAQTWADNIVSDIDSCRCDVREEAFRTIARLSTSSADRKNALTKALAARATSISELLRASDQHDIFPLVASLRTLIEGFSPNPAVLPPDDAVSSLTNLLSIATFAPAVTCKQSGGLQTN
jgi:hypothetical protein